MNQIENPRIRPIGNLLHETFLVPRYQRGFRWGKQEITELLDDIFQYSTSVNLADNQNQVGDFYCLQPIVVKASKWTNQHNEEVNGFELVDGQQRLTTLYIILTYLESIRQFHDRNYDLYSIDYETRENCKLFFTSKAFTKQIDDSNVDFYHISKAHEFVKQWFEDKPTHMLDILRTILNPKKNISIIWYEAKQDSQQDQEEDSIDLFTRLNDGKIPLTDSELIKALILQADLYQPKEERFVRQRLFEIASEWDEIESILQNEQMWLFINDINYQPSSKIELIFKILAERWNGENEDKLIRYDPKDGRPKHFEYLVFDKYLARKRREYKSRDYINNDVLDPVNNIWREVKEINSTFVDWYADHTVFHYLGYLFTIENANKERLIRELISMELTKTDFIKYLKKRIANALKIQKKKDNSPELKQLSELSYGSDDYEIRRILLLFNIEALIGYKKEDARFPFHLYKKEKITSLEHIHPQNPESIDTDDDRSKLWLKSHKETLVLIKPTGLEQTEQVKNALLDIDALLQNFNKDNFKILFSNIIELYNKLADFKENELHTLYNLALVDKDTNSALNNSFFDIKREIIKEKQLVRYIPICTQRVFSKYYSKSPQELMFWRNEDRKAYFQAIENTYNSFIKLLEVEDGNE